MSAFDQAIRYVKYLTGSLSGQRLFGQEYIDYRINHDLKRADQQKVWEEWGKANYYQQRAADPPSDQTIFNVIKRARAKRVLEAGVGYGRNLKHIHATISPDIQLAGVDFAESMLKHARQFLGDIPTELVRGDITDRLPFSDQVFDVVFTSGTLQHIGPDSIDQVYQELCRLTKNYLVLVEADQPGYGNGKLIAEHWFKDHIYSYHHDENLRALGWVIESNARPKGNPNARVVVAKRFL
ncbi:class I SAM-dependent methyltransferase [Candidatus Berkelbacteria bacterium]|nr:class I SAM-dependent methyltransferase [Candidatus Berkelbacteria bacterium]